MLFIEISSFFFKTPYNENYQIITQVGRKSIPNKNLPKKANQVKRHLKSFCFTSSIFLQDLHGFLKQQRNGNI